jgi:ATP-binding cassette subfamily F protein uup
VSHDRQFLDQVVTSLLVFKGRGEIEEQVGGFSDWIARGGELHSADPSVVERALPDLLEKVVEAGVEAGVKEVSTAASKAITASDDGASYEARKHAKSEQRRLQRQFEQIPVELQRLEASENEIMVQVSQPDFFNLPEAAQQKAYSAAQALREKIQVLYDQWAAVEAALEAFTSD